jgi:hypothetical protein
VCFQIAQHHIVFTKVAVNGISICTISMLSPTIPEATSIALFARHRLELVSSLKDTLPGTWRNSRYLLYHALSQKSTLLNPTGNQQEE